MVSYIPPIKMPVWLGDGKHEIVLPALNIINLCKNGRRSLAWIYPSHRSLSRCFWSSKAFSVSSLPAISKAWKRWRRQNLWRMTWTSYLSYLVAPSPPLWNNKPLINHPYFKRVWRKLGFTTLGGTGHNLPSHPLKRSFPLMAPPSPTSQLSGMP